MLKVNKKTEVEEVFEEVWDEEPGTVDPIFCGIRYCVIKDILYDAVMNLWLTSMKTMLMSKSKLIISEHVKLKSFER